MAIFSVDNLESGMILKSQVCDRSGRMLLPEGVELDEKHLKVFRTWGISEVDIESDDEDEGQLSSEAVLNGDPAVIAAAEQEVEHLFMLNDKQHQMIHELMRISVSRRVANAA